MTEDWRGLRSGFELDGAMDAVLRAMGGWS